jgi:L1 cell adhesion molecule like protein
LLGKFELTGIPPSPRGVPQISVAFDIDANGILNVSAEDKTTGIKNKITITNDKGRLTKEDIDRMVLEAEKYKTEDAEHKASVDAKNALEHLVYSLISNVKTEENDSSVSAPDKEKIATARTYLENTITWLNNNPSLTKSDFEDKAKEVENNCRFITCRARDREAGSAGSSPAGKGSSNETSTENPQGSGPNIEEVD